MFREGTGWLASPAEGRPSKSFASLRNTSRTIPGKRTARRVTSPRLLWLDGFRAKRESRTIAAAAEKDSLRRCRGAGGEVNGAKLLVACGCIHSHGFQSP